MSEQGQLEAENSISGQLQAVLRQLTTDQIRFVVARQEFDTDKEAALSANLKPNTVYQWKCRSNAPIDEAVRLMALDGLIAATELRRRNLAKAMSVKVKGLDEKNAKLRQDVATEIIEWEMGKATQKIESKGEVDNRLVIEFVNDWRAANQAAEPAPGPDSGQE